MTANPASAVNRDDHRQWLFRFGKGDVRQQSRTMNSAVDDVFSNNDLGSRFLVSQRWLSRDVIHPKSEQADASRLNRRPSRNARLSEDTLPSRFINSSVIRLHVWLHNERQFQIRRVINWDCWHSISPSPFGR